MKPWAEKFYKSKAWQECRQAYFIYKHGICERCGDHGEIVHHKIYLTPMNINDPNITLSFDNLELLCLDCHNKEHTKKGSAQDGLMFDEEGNLIQSPQGAKIANCLGTGGRPFENLGTGSHDRCGILR